MILLTAGIALVRDTEAAIEKRSMVVILVEHDLFDNGTWVRESDSTPIPCKIRRCLICWKEATRDESRAAQHGGCAWRLNEKREGSVP